MAKDQGVPEKQEAVNQKADNRGFGGVLAKMKVFRLTVH